MTVKERTAGGYTKVETKNGVTRYHDPNGHPTDQQAFAGSKAQEQNDYEITERGEDGEIKDTEVKDDDDEVVDPPVIDAIRITASFEAETDDTTGFHAGDSVGVDAEISGIFPTWDVPDEDDIKDKMKQIRESVADQMVFASDADINVGEDEVRAVAPARGWESIRGDDAVNISFDSGYEKDFDVDASQTKITDDDWDK